jgi:hypothetical protein
MKRDTQKNPYGQTTVNNCQLQTDEDSPEYMIPDAMPRFSTNHSNIRVAAGK